MDQASALTVTLFKGRLDMGLAENKAFRLGRGRAS